jgi:hypothetical protein
MRRFASIAAIVATLTTGCYSVEPLATLSPTPGTRLALSINDGGRVALGGSMGPEIGKVEGNLISKQDSTYVLSVIGVDYLNGTFQKWQGETVRINSAMISGFYTKRFSKGRTAVFLAGATAAAFLVTHRFNGTPSLPEPDSIAPPVITARYPLPIRLQIRR